jgi:hypothetical protein
MELLPSGGFNSSEINPSINWGRLIIRNFYFYSDIFTTESRIPGERHFKFDKDLSSGIVP